MDYDSDKRAAVKRLASVVDDLDLSDVERRKLDWLTRWEADTIDAFASIITKARAQS
jgi:hypothetical protein